MVATLHNIQYSNIESMRYWWRLLHFQLNTRRNLNNINKTFPAPSFFSLSGVILFLSLWCVLKIIITIIIILTINNHNHRGYKIQCQHSWVLGQPSVLSSNAAGLLAMLVERGDCASNINSMLLLFKSQLGYSSTISSTHWFVHFCLLINPLDVWSYDDHLPKSLVDSGN